MNCFLQLLIQNLKLDISFLGLNLRGGVIILTLKSINIWKIYQRSVNLLIHYNLRSHWEQAVAWRALKSQGLSAGQACISPSVFHGGRVGRPRCMRSRGSRKAGQLSW